MKTSTDSSASTTAISAKTLFVDLLRPAFARHWRRLALGFLALLVVDFLQLIIPRILKHGVDRLETLTANAKLLLQLGAIIVAIALVIVALRFCWRYLIIGFSRLLEQDLRNRIFSHIVKMDAPFFDRRTTGDLMAHASNDLNAVQMACGMGMVAAVDALVMSLAAIAFMIAIHPMLTLMALLPMPILALSTRYLSARLHHRFARVQERFGEMTEAARSTMVSIGLIKAYTMEAFQTEAFAAIGRKYVQENLRVARIQGLISPLATMVGGLGMLMVLFFGGRLVIEKVITLGDFVAFITYLYMLIWPMMAIGWVANLVQRGLTSLTRIHNLFAAQVSMPLEPAGEYQLTGVPAFRLENLSFTYDKAKTPALQNLSIEIGPGIEGFTGRTGSGKTTLCRLLCRIYPVADGQLFFHSHDVNLLGLAALRDRIAYVSQEPVLFSKSIADNIALGRPEANREEIIEAAKAAAVHQDIEQLPGGYDTLIGERGVRLSGGQRQRLALARALLCARPVLVIDDGLSAVDVATEHEVFAGLRQHARDKTVIIVSNRIKLLSLTDRITILADGKIAHRGSHQELLAQNPLYQAMHQKQMEQETGAEVA